MWFFPLYESHNMRLKYVSFKRYIKVFHIKVDSKAFKSPCTKQLTNTSIFYLFFFYNWNIVSFRGLWICRKCILTSFHWQPTLISEYNELEFEYSIQNTYIYMYSHMWFTLLFVGEKEERLWGLGYRQFDWRRWYVIDTFFSLNAH